MFSRSTLWILISLAVSGVFLWLAFARIDWSAVRTAMDQAQVFPWLPLGIALYCAGHWVRGQRCRMLVSGEAKLRRGTATRIVVMGYAVNNVLPLRLGEVARAGMLTRFTGLPFTQSLTVTFAERLFDGVVLLLMLLATGLVLPLQGWMRPAVLIAALSLGLAVLALALLIASPHAITLMVARLTGPLGPGPQAACQRLLAHVLSGVAYLRRPGHALRILLITVAIWLFDAALFWTVLVAFDLSFQPGWALLTMTVTNIGILVPSAPGHIGPFHYFAMQALISLGVGRAAAAAVALVAHLAIFVPLTLWGAWILWRQGLELGATMAAVRQARQARSVMPDRPGEMLAPASYREPPAATTPFMRSLTEAFLPLHDGPADRAGREAAVDRAAAFLCGQIRELPPRLRGLFRLGCWGFRTLTVLRTGRGFTALPLARRRNLAAAWAYGSFPPARQLFRPVRSLVLLAWYEPPRAASAAAGRVAS